jgi:hypothetical protein
MLSIFSPDSREMYVNSGKVKTYAMDSFGMISYVNVDFMSKVPEQVA